MSAHAHDHDTGQPLLPVEEARRRVLDAVAPLPPRRLSLRDAHGCVLAEDVAAPGDLPPFTSSAMDGFAVRAADVAGATIDAPTPLRIVGRVAMGRASGVAVGPGEAVAVPTGGVIPEGADAVVPIERCVVDGDLVRVLQGEPPGRHVRRAGEDARRGERLVPRGRRLLAGEVGLLASAGIADVAVHPRARVLVVSTGDELVEPGEATGPGRIPDANSLTLHGQIVEAGAIPVPAGIVPDDADALLEALAAHRQRADVFVSSGGVSVGERDPVKRAFRARSDVRFVEVAMQPGKPQAFGTVHGRPFFGLPGNPVSVFVSFEVFVRPALMAMMGRPPDRPEVTATLESDIGGPPEKTRFARVRVRREDGRWTASSTGGRQSNLLSTVARANGLAVIPPGVAVARAGEPCRVMLFRDADEVPS
ncbi:MAG TPA: gephyrin-like molybdotransferase Glp [Actinomycetota bacterium]|nr:gephyrin-like molybdotransferase Glp [Actinomycetota bacterium]